tara:strand:- start:866 stop:1396 length:531 start_codon:yes stop_codon:yes gene_type:complete
MIEYNKTKLADGKSSIIINNGDCYIESNVDIMGIEIDFIGAASITPTLPEGWIMQGNKSKMILVSLQGVGIKNQKLFTYFGSIKINNIIVANNEGKSVFCKIENVNPTWIRQNWSMDKETDTWDNFKNKAKKGKISKTKYNLPNYDLPKVDKTKIKIKRRKPTSTSGGSSGGSGGY